MKPNRYPYSKINRKSTTSAGNISATNLSVGSIDEKRLQMVIEKLREQMEQYNLPKIEIECEEFTDHTDSFFMYPRHEYHFDNGYGASVIHNKYSYGLELAVIKHNKKTGSWDLDYESGITNDVIGYIKGKEELEEILIKISNL